MEHLFDLYMPYRHWKVDFDALSKAEVENGFFSQKNTFAKSPSVTAGSHDFGPLLLPVHRLLHPPGDLPRLLRRRGILQQVQGQEEQECWKRGIENVLRGFLKKRALYFKSASHVRQFHEIQYLVYL